MIIQHNIMALNSHRQLGGNNTMVAKNLEKLSSGFRINRAGDDAAGLAISEKMRAQITGLTRAQQNAQDGISLVQTAEGALTEVHSMLNRMVDLAMQSSNGTMDKKVDGDRQKIQDEVSALLEEIDRISMSTNFNGINLLDGKLGGYNGTNTAGGGIAIGGISVSGGKLADTDTITVAVTAASGITVGGTAVTGVTWNTTSAPEANGTYTLVATVDRDTASAADAEKYEGLTVTVKMGGTPADGNAVFTVAADADGNIGGGLNLQIGDTSDPFNKVTVSVDDMSTKGLSIKDLDVSTEEAASNALNLIKSAINTVSTNRSKLGALQNRLEHTINNLGVTTENMTAAESRIRDVDMAKEMMAFTKNNVLTQAAQAMLAQANQQPQQVLQLLR